MIDRKQVLPHTIAALATDHPRVDAMIDVGGQTATWQDLHDTIMRWSGAFSSLGVGQGDTVVTMLPNSFDAYFAWLGLAWLRAIEVPANNMYLGQTLLHILEDSQATILVISARYVDRLSTVAAETTHLATVVVPDADGELPDLPYRLVRGEEFLDAPPAADLTGPDYYDTAALIYTSGTTGPSKGVIAPWAELQQAPEAMPSGLLAEGDPYYSTYPAFHLSGKVALYLAAAYRGTLLIRESFSATEFWSDMRTHNVKAVGLIGAMASILMAQPETDADADNPVEKVVMGPIIPNVEDFKRRFGIAHVGTGYGMTEIGFPLVSGWDPPNPRTCGRRRQGPPHYEVRVVDDHDETVPSGTPGELVVRSGDPWVLSGGYWRQPEKTAECWRNGWWHTGDVFIEDDDGWLFFVDRKKDALRRRGENISSFEVEAGIAEHPEVLEVAVVAVASEHGEDDVKAVIVRAPGSELAPRELIEWLSPRMPRFMIPRYIEFVDALPKTDGTFRTQKYMLRAQGVTEATWDREQS